MIVVVVPELGVGLNQLDYSGGVYEYVNTNIKKSFEQFTLELINDLNLIYKAENRVPNSVPISELPDDSGLWKPTLSPSAIYEYRGYLKIHTMSTLNTYSVYVFSSTADGRFYSWKEHRFDKIFNGIMERQKEKRYVCKVFYTSYAKKPQLDTFVLYKRNIEDLRNYLGEKYNPANRFRHVSTSDKSNTSFSELFYAEDNCLELAILVEEEDN